MSRDPMKQDNVSSIASSIAAVDRQTPFIRGFLKTWAERTPESVAIAAPGQRPLTYRRLRAQVEYVALNATGIGRGDRVAMIFPNGPEMPTSFLGVAAAMTCAPLNPEYRADEFAFYLADLRAKALIIQFVVDSLARSIAKAQILSLNCARLRSRKLAFLLFTAKDPGFRFAVTRITG